MQGKSMIKYHPNDNLLVEFSAGSLPFAQSIAVSAHLYFCTHCQQRVGKLNCLGAGMMNDIEPVAVSEDLLGLVMSRLTSDTAQVPDPVTAPARRSAAKMPGIIEKILKSQGAPKWKFVTPSLNMARLKTGQREYEVALHKIKAGGSVAKHDHRGTEITLILDGSFSDEEGIYNKGDFLVREQGQPHRPLASQDAPCICLSVVAAPVRLTGTFHRLLNPFLGFKPE